MPPQYTTGTHGRQSEIGRERETHTQRRYEIGQQIGNRLYLSLILVYTWVGASREGFTCSRTQIKSLEPLYIASSHIFSVYLFRIGVCAQKQKSMCVYMYYVWFVWLFQASRQMDYLFLYLLSHLFVFHWWYIYGAPALVIFMEHYVWYCEPYVIYR